MFDVGREGRDRADAERRAIEEHRDERWGADRREADAFIMTQLTHNERALQEIKLVLVLLGMAGLAMAEGYSWVAWIIAILTMLMVGGQELSFNKRQASVTRLMGRNWPSEE